MSRTGRIAQGVVTTCLLAIVPGCADIPKPGAIGASREVSIFYNVDADGPGMVALREVFEYEIDVVSLEEAYVLDPVPFSRFDTHRQVKNQIFLVDMSRDDGLARDVLSMLGERGRELYRQGDPFRILVHDQWATGQTTLFLIGRSETELVGLLRRDVPGLRRQYENAVVQGLAKTMLALGEEDRLTRKTAQDFGWSVRLPLGFFAAMDFEGNFVKFNADDPARLVLVHWMDETLPLDPEEWTTVLAQILFRYNDEDVVLEESTELFPAAFQGEPALRWEGVWQNEKYTIGGPFRAVAFHRDGRSYLLIALVFNPGNDKVPPLRRTEAILHTFQTVPR